MNPDLPRPEARPDEPRGRRHLRELGHRFRDHVFEYVEKGGTSYSSMAIGAEEHAVIKTLVFQIAPIAGSNLPTEFASFDGHIMVLMHGDWNVDTQALLAHLHRQLEKDADSKAEIGTHSTPGNMRSTQRLRKVAAADPQQAEKWTGYRVGGTAPFALANALPIYVEASVLKLPRIWINAGARGHLLEMETSTLTSTLQLQPIRAGKPRAPRV
ncbi:MAG TPA: YbaK/EbsC family protein [Pseudobdellovibrionaceae bacterium]|nr:YbaK/EbsC family protein [Pseudobdellovibrionaceae bacterium]